MSRITSLNLEVPANCRTTRFLRENENPHELKIGTVKVRVSYAGECGLNEAVSRYLAARDNVKEAIQTK